MLISPSTVEGKEGKEKGNKYKHFISVEYHTDSNRGKEETR